MLLTQAIQGVRDSLDDNNVNVSLRKWTDAEITRHIDLQLLAMFRRMVHSSKEWSNMILGVQGLAARTIFQNTYEWRLPTWVEAVVAVYYRTGNTTGPTASQYLWTDAAGVQLGKIIEKSTPENRRGWTWEGNHTLRLWDWASSPPALSLRVAAQPHPLFRAKLTTVYPKATGFYLPTPQIGSVGLEEGRYTNADVQVVETASGTSTNLGAIRRCVWSLPNSVSSGTRYNEIFVDEAWPVELAQNDIVESVLPISELHTRLLVLRVVQACGVKFSNLPLQRYIADELRGEEAAFMEYAEPPRDKAGPYWRSSSSRSRGPYNPDRPWGWGGWGSGA